MQAIAQTTHTPAPAPATTLEPAPAAAQPDTLATPQAAPRRGKRAPARTHLDIANAQRAPVRDHRPACGQLNGTKTARAQTFYSRNTDVVSCLKCAKTKVFAKALAMQAESEAIAEATTAEAVEAAEVDAE